MMGYSSGWASVEWLWTEEQAGNLHWCTCSVNTLPLLLSHISRVQLCATPETAAHQAPPSLGFSRQEYWSGLPFPSPMHESEKWKWRRSVVSNPQRPHGLQPTRLLRPWDFPGKSTGVGCHCLLRLTRYSNWNLNLVVGDLMLTKPWSFESCCWRLSVN